MARKKSRGREVIDILVDAFKQGQSFEGLAEMRAFVMRTGAFKPHELYEIGAWERQARYNLARENVAVTNPTPRNGQTRNPNATPSERVESRDKLYKDLGTRVGHISLFAKSDAAQVDASRREIERDIHLDMLRVHVARLRELETV